MDLEGVKDVQPIDDDFQHYFTVMCTSCREEHPKIVSFNAKVSRLHERNADMGMLIWWGRTRSRFQDQEVQPTLYGDVKTAR